VPLKIGQNGTWSQDYVGPYAGFISQLPENLIPENGSPSFNNFMLRNAELRSRPTLINPFGIGVGSGPTAPQLGITSFVDVNGTYHTVIWAGENLYQYNPALLPAPPFALVGQAAPGDMQTNTVSYRAFANTIWYTNKAALIGANDSPIINPFLGRWDGLSAVPQFTQTYSDASTSESIAGISLTDSPTVGGSLPGAPTVVGPLSIGGLYLGELNNQLILANISVLDQSSGVIYSYPNMIWWSANGLPLQWDPTQNTSAGFNPFLDVPDLITGLVTLGIAGYIFRTNGITQFSTTGSAVAPFTFDHMWASDHGIGNVLPFSIAQYGPSAAFISTDNIYNLSVSSANAIGGLARDAIFDNLSVASSTPFANIVPIFDNGYVYLTYQIYIPLATSGIVRVWVYSFDEKNWAPWDLGISAQPPSPVLTCAANVV
jgi:hypothetical protein